MSVKVKKIYLKLTNEDNDSSVADVLASYFPNPQSEIVLCRFDLDLMCDFGSEGVDSKIVKKVVEECRSENLIC